MQGPGFARRRAVVASLAAIAAALWFLGASTGAAVAPLQHHYLALGDSITFGYVSQPAPTPDGSNPFSNPDTFAGYPAYVGAALRLETVDAACPGETSTSIMAFGTPDAGCASYRAAYPLHVAYAELTQLQFAEAFLQANPDTQLVTVAIGINDVGLAVSRCGGIRNASCLERDLPSVLTTVRSNLTTIVRALRATGTRATIVVVNYYALEYANTRTTRIVRALDGTIAQVAADERVRVADSFDAFKHATDAMDGDACVSGLFGPGSSTLGPCDLHPSEAGQRLLASAVESAVRG